MQQVMIDPKVHQQGYGAVSHGDDGALVVQFSKQEIEIFVPEDAPKDTPRTAMKEFITIKIPGNKLTEVHRLVKAEDRVRFAPQYQAFLAGEDFSSGTPLEAAPFLRKEDIAVLKKLDIFTVEQFAGVSDTNLMAVRIPNAANVRDLARSFLTRGPERAEVEQRQSALERENAELKERLAAIEQMLAAGGVKLGADPKGEKADAGDGKGAKK